MTRHTLTLPYPVSANRYWRHAMIGGRAATFLSKEAKAYKAETAWLAKQAGIAVPLTGRLSLLIRLYPDRPQDWAKRASKDPVGWDDTVRCIDLGNCEKVLSDALNGIAWVDDKQLRRIVLDRCEPDDKGGRVELEIEAVQAVLVARGMFG